jgi:hypothetical protein
MGKVVLAGVAEDLDRPTCRSSTHRSAVTSVEDGHELVDRLGVPEVSGQGKRQLGQIGWGAAPVQVLVVVGEQEQEPVLRLSVEGQELRPPGREDVLGLVHHDDVVTRPQHGGGVLHQFGEDTLEVVAGRSFVLRLLGNDQAGVLGDLAAQLVEVVHLQVGHSANGLSEEVP